MKGTNLRCRSIAELSKASGLPAPDSAPPRGPARPLRLQGDCGVRGAPAGQRGGAGREQASGAGGVSKGSALPPSRAWAAFTNAARERFSFVRTHKNRQIP